MNAPRGDAARLWIFGIVGAAACAAPFFVPRVSQIATYHDFADRRELFGIINFGDVASNLPFAPAGVFGFLFAWRAAAGDGRAFATPWQRFLYIIFFAGVFLTTFGSSYYHLAPDNLRVLWDRLPIAIACGALAMILLAERVSEPLSQWLFGPWMAFSCCSVVYWYFTETAGFGDLRFWGLAQFFPALAIPLGIVLFPKRYTFEHYYFYALLFYVAAKLFEWKDRFVYEAIGVSGHTLKHLAAAAAAGCLFWMLRKRRAVGPAEAPAP
ncbi:MAG: alkaline phytoceramidase [Planctomycetes bacterium]|nr:alkaline phytoceramidase [Planctomycetota bacterium]